MLTTQGRLTLLAAVALFVAGRLFGTVELYVLGAVLVVLVAVTAIGVSLTRIRIEVSRELYPPRVHAGTPSRVEVKVINQGSGRSPLLSLHDAVSGTRGRACWWDRCTPASRPGPPTGCPPTGAAS